MRIARAVTFLATGPSFFQAINKISVTSTDQTVEALEAKQLGKEDKVNAAISHDLRVYARTRWPDANDKYRKARLADLLKLSARRVRSLWNGEDTAVVRQHEAEAVRRLIGLREIEEANRDDFRALQARIARLEDVLFAQDAEFHQPQVDALRQSLAGRRGDDVAGRSD